MCIRDRRCFLGLGYLRLFRYSFWFFIAYQNAVLCHQIGSSNYAIIVGDVYKRQSEGAAAEATEITWWAFPTFGVDTGYEQELADAFTAAHPESVSYTHLDVYKRQRLWS